MQPSETNQDPFQGEFFDSESPIADRLVREAIQNSMDARIDRSARVLVRFAFSGERDALSPPVAAEFLRGLQRHLEAGAPPGSPDNLPQYFDRSMPFLTIEDFGTRGLIGDIIRNSEKEEGNHFWGFFRSVGISPKTESEGGSWGLGKWVFPDASDISAFLGITQREGENNLLLMGQAVLRTHSVEHEKFRPYGWFAAYSDDAEADWLPMPVDYDALVNRACSAFRLSRMRDGVAQSGLSVIVPFPDEELTPEAIARAVVTQYFMPIINSELEVEIHHPDQQPTSITAGTISEIASRIEPSDRDDESPSSMQSTVRLAQWAATANHDDFMELGAPTTTVEMDDEDKERYDSGMPLGFKLSIDTTLRAEEVRGDSEFLIVVQKDDGLEKGHDYFVRGFLRLPKMDHIRQYHARALVLVDGLSDLGHMLRDAEGPAHMRWEPNAKRVTQNWVGATTRVQRVRAAASRILHALTTRPSTLQRHALADLFPSPHSSLGSSGGSGQKPGTDPPQPPPPPPGEPSPLHVTRTAKGFRVDHNSGSARSPHGSWRMRIAYDVSRGNPFKAFESGVKNKLPDFTLFEGGEISVKGKGFTGQAIADNVLDFDVAADDFRVAITGFDGRDLAVDIAPRSAPEENESS